MTWKTLLREDRIIDTLPDAPPPRDIPNSLGVDLTYLLPSGKEDMADHRIRLSNMYEDERSMAQLADFIYRRSVHGLVDAKSNFLLNRSQGYSATGAPLYDELVNLIQDATSPDTSPDQERSPLTDHFPGAMVHTLSTYEVCYLQICFNWNIVTLLAKTSILPPALQFWY